MIEFVRGAMAMIQLPPVVATEFFGVPANKKSKEKTLKLLPWNLAQTFDTYIQQEVLIDPDQIQPERLEQFDLGFDFHVPFYTWLRNSLTNEFTRKHYDIFLIWRLYSLGGPQEHFIVFRQKGKNNGGRP